MPHLPPGSVHLRNRFHGFGVDTVQALMLAGRRELGLPSDETLAGDDQNQTEQKVECSFCGSAIAEGSRHAVAGPSVFICRECIGICIEVMATEDPAWRDQKIEALQKLQLGTD